MISFNVIGNGGSVDCMAEPEHPECQGRLTETKLNNIKENPSNIKETLTLHGDKILHRHRESIWLRSA